MNLIVDSDLESSSSSSVEYDFGVLRRDAEGIEVDRNDNDTEGGLSSGSLRVKTSVVFLL